MADPRTPPIFDGHNDTLSTLALADRRSAARRFRDCPRVAIDAQRARRGGFAGGLFAVWIPSDDAEGIDFAALADARFDVPLPAPLAQNASLAKALSQIALLFALERQQSLTIARTVSQIQAAMASYALTAVLHLEGAEPIDGQLHALDVLYAAGLRSLGPVWSRPNRFGHGVPFRFPATPDTGPGLTEDGVRLVQRCEALGILVDVSHLTEAGFWDVAAHTTKPLVASHSNAHALCPASRNLTDRQLDAIAERGGLVGLNFATAFLREDGRMLPDVPLETVLRHLDHLVERLGEDGVGLGSDYDGAVVPQALKGVECLPALRQAMRAHGYGEALMERICHRNWLRVLSAHWAE